MTEKTEKDFYLKDIKLRCVIVYSLNILMDGWI
jgi:hypothetical protein